MRNSLVLGRSLGSCAFDEIVMSASKREYDALACGTLWLEILEIQCFPEYEMWPLGTALVVQWLRICLPVQGMQVSSLAGSRDPTRLETIKLTHFAAYLKPTQHCKSNTFQ